MSVSIATNGLFVACGTSTSVASIPPHPKQEATKPKISIGKVELLTINSFDEQLKNIKIKLIDSE